ncbi:MAG: SpoIIE family protein phosphatase [Anaerolineae bacterium]|nr:SpoIIE family protein phosphatase [Phycisphaerae bacterium]
MDMMREMSLQTDPQAMVRNYMARVRQVMPVDGFISLSRRGLNRPRVRITRSNRWGMDVNPWTAREHVVLESGLLSELIWNEEARIINDLVVDPNDPAAPYLEGMRSLMALPLFDHGHALNMTVQLRKNPRGPDVEGLPERVWMSNLFGRATQNLVLSDEVAKAYAAIDRELETVADMQRALLPRELPKIPGLELAAHYETARRAGGDYYDFFELPDGKLGLLIADVSGHGTPAAVMMAVTHSIAHTHTGPPTPPSKLLDFINKNLSARYTTDSGTFVTAFYGIYDPHTRQITYSSAGHCPPRAKRFADGKVVGLDGALSLPLGIEPAEIYRDVTATLHPGDALVLHTDGITEAHRPGSSALFGQERLDAVLTACGCDAETLIRNTLLAVEEFTDSAAPSDDMTLLVAKVAK